jgi:hypothetical protein
MIENCKNSGDEKMLNFFAPIHPEKTFGSSKHKFFKFFIFGGLWWLSWTQVYRPRDPIQSGSNPDPKPKVQNTTGTFKEPNK